MFAEGAGAECPAEGLRMSLQKNVSNAAGGTPAEGDQNNPMKLSSMAGNNNGGRPLRKVNKYCSLACGRYEEHEEHARAKSTKPTKNTQPQSQTGSRPNVRFLWWIWAITGSRQLRAWAHQAFRTFACHNRYWNDTPAIRNQSPTSRRSPTTPPRVTNH